MSWWGGGGVSEQPWGSVTLLVADVFLPYSPDVLCLLDVGG